MVIYLDFLTGYHTFHHNATEQINHSIPGCISVTSYCMDDVYANGNKTLSIVAFICATLWRVYQSWAFTPIDADVDQL